MKKNPYNESMSKRELVCQICGFITFSYRDMIEHLAQYVNLRGYRRVPEENCKSKIIQFGNYKKGKGVGR